MTMMTCLYSYIPPSRMHAQVRMHTENEWQLGLFTTNCYKLLQTHVTTVQSDRKHGYQIHYPGPLSKHQHIMDHCWPSWFVLISSHILLGTGNRSEMGQESPGTPRSKLCSGLKMRGSTSFRRLSCELCWTCAMCRARPCGLRRTWFRGMGSLWHGLAENGGAQWNTHVDNYIWCDTHTRMYIIVYIYMCNIYICMYTYTHIYIDIYLCVCV